MSVYYTDGWPNGRAPAEISITPVTYYEWETVRDGVTGQRWERVVGVLNGPIAPVWSGSVELWVPPGVGRYTNNDDLWWASGWQGDLLYVLRRCHEEAAKLEAERDDALRAHGCLEAMYGAAA